MLSFPDIKHVLIVTALTLILCFSPIGFDLYYHLFYLSEPDLAFGLNNPNSVFGVPFERYVFFQYLSFVNVPQAYVLISLSIFAWLIVAVFAFSFNTVIFLIFITGFFHFLVFWTPFSLGAGAILSALVLSFHKSWVIRFFGSAIVFLALLTHPLSIVMIGLLQALLLLNKKIKQFIMLGAPALAVIALVVFFPPGPRPSLEGKEMFPSVWSQNTPEIQPINERDQLLLTRPPNVLSAMIRAPLDYNEWPVILRQLADKKSPLAIAFCLLLLVCYSLNRPDRIFLGQQNRKILIFSVFVTVLTVGMALKSRDSSSLAWALINHMQDKISTNACIRSSGEFVALQSFGIENDRFFPNALNAELCVKIPKSFSRGFVWPQQNGMDVFEFRQLLNELKYDRDLDLRYVIGDDGNYWVFEMLNVYQPKYSSFTGSKSQLLKYVEK
jgi:hypothetical protein